jgi:predicted transcriptional regulator
VRISHANVAFSILYDYICDFGISYSANNTFPSEISHNIGILIRKIEKKFEGIFLIWVDLMWKCVSSLCFKKNWTRFFQNSEKISEVTIFKNKYLLKNKNHPLAVLKEEASDNLLPIYQA